jgi:hypothetical protein
MPFSDLPMSGLFLLFLLFFMLVGLYPAWKRVAAKTRKLLKGMDKLPLVDSGLSKTVDPGHKVNRFVGQLNNYELLVFRYLAPRAAKGLSSQLMRAGLHLERKNVTHALKSLLNRGLIRVAVTRFFGVRFFLSEKGRIYAAEQDLIPRTRD